MTLKGSCHCKATQFEVTEAPATVTRCTCSICSKRAALWAYYSLDQFKLTTPQDAVATYEWQSKTVKLNFCTVCGCSTFNVSPSWVDYQPDFEHPRIAVNVRLFDDFDLDAVSVEVLDGRNLW